MATTIRVRVDATPSSDDLDELRNILVDGGVRAETVIDIEEEDSSDA